MTANDDSQARSPRDAWRRFGARALGDRLQRSATPAVELLVAGVVLGPACMLDLIAAHHDRIDDAIVTLDDVLVPGLATVRSDSGALLLRLLGRHADAEAVDALQAAFAHGRQAFHQLRADGAERADLDAIYDTLVTLQIEPSPGKVTSTSPAWPPAEDID